MGNYLFCMGSKGTLGCLESWGVRGHFDYGCPTTCLGFTRGPPSSPVTYMMVDEIAVQTRASIYVGRQKRTCCHLSVVCTQSCRVVSVALPLSLSRILPLFVALYRCRCVSNVMYEQFFRAYTP